MNEIHPHHRFLKGIMWMCFSAICISVSVILVKTLASKMPFYELVFFRFFFPLIITSPILFFYDEGIKIFQTKNLKSHFYRSLFVVLFQYSLFYYIGKASVLNASVMLNTDPLFITLLSWIFLKQKVKLPVILGVVIAFIGVLLILHPDTGIFSFTSLIGLLSGLFSGISQVIFGYHAEEEKSTVCLFYLYFFSTLLTFMPLALVRLFENKFFLFTPFGEEAHTIYALILFLSFMSIFSQYFKGLAFAQGKPDTLSAFLYLSVIFTGIWGFIFFGAVPSLLAIFGAFLVIVGGSIKASLIYLHFKRKKY